MRDAVRVSGTSPVLIDRYLKDAIEVDVDAVSDGSTVEIAGIMEHIEEAGIHSGDSACSLPPYSLPKAVIAPTIPIDRLLRDRGAVRAMAVITHTNAGR